MIPTYEQLVDVLRRSCYDGLAKVGNIGEITRGTRTDKTVHVTLKPDRRTKKLPALNIAVSHSRCYDLEDLMFEKDGGILMMFTLHPERYDSDYFLRGV